MDSGALSLMALEGVAALTKQLDALGKLDDGKALRAAVREAAKPAVEKAKALIPEGVDAHRTYKGRLVAPGFAKRNIRAVTTLSKDKQKASAIIGVRREAFYAVQFVEIGTSKMAAEPWLRPALDSTQAQCEQRLADSLKTAVDKAART